MKNAYCLRKKIKYYLYKKPNNVIYNEIIL